MTLIKIANKHGKTSLQKSKKEKLFHEIFKNKKGVTEALWSVKKVDLILLLEN